VVFPRMFVGGRQWDPPDPDRKQTQVLDTSLAVGFVSTEDTSRAPFTNVAIYNDP
jgi:hypothetical protein